MRHSFQWRQRIHRRTEFDRVYDEGRRAHGRFMTLIIRPSNSPVSRLGISVTRKLGNAVDRNSAKRHIREIFRQHVPALPADLVVIPRPAFLEADFKDLVADYRAVVAKQEARTAQRNAARKS